MNSCRFSKGKKEGWKGEGRNECGGKEEREERKNKEEGNTGLEISGTGCIFMAVNARAATMLPMYGIHRWKT